MSKLKDLNNNVHFVMQSKGGAGKSVVALTLGSYLLEKGGSLNFDTDPGNKTFSTYEKLDVRKIEVMGKDETVDPSKFDELIEAIVESEAPCIIDTGASDFHPLNAYMRINNLPTLFQEAGKKMVIHVPVTHDKSQLDTLRCLALICANFPDAQIVVWDNHFHGEPEKPMSEFKVIQQHASQIVGIITFKELNEKMHRASFTKMMKKGFTFFEVEQLKNDPDFSFMEKNRIKQVKKDLFDGIESLLGEDKPAKANKAAAKA